MFKKSLKRLAVYSQSVLEMFKEKMKTADILSYHILQRCLVIIVLYIAEGNIL